MTSDTLSTLMQGHGTLAISRGQGNSQAWIQLIESGARVAQVPIPTDVRVFWAEGERVYILEIPPRMQLIGDAMEMDDEFMEDEDIVDASTFRLVAFPYTVCLLDTVDKYLSVFWRNEPLSSLTDKVGMAGLPNVETTGYVCLGNTITHPTRFWSGVEEAMGMIMAFFGNPFVHDLGAWKRTIADVRGFPRTLKEWERMSKEDPGFILKCKWLVTGTLAEYAEDFVYDVWCEQEEQGRLVREALNVSQ